MLARPARRATYHRALRSGELIPQNERDSAAHKGAPLGALGRKLPPNLGRWSLRWLQGN